MKRSTRSTLRDAHLAVEEEDGARVTLLGHTRILRYHLQNGAVVELSFVGICGGKKTLEIITRWGSEYGRAAIAQAVSTLRPATVELPEDCVSVKR